MAGLHGLARGLECLDRPAELVRDPIRCYGPRFAGEMRTRNCGYGLAKLDASVKCSGFNMMLCRSSLCREFVPARALLEGAQRGTMWLS